MIWVTRERSTWPTLASSTGAQQRCQTAGRQGDATLGETVVESRMPDCHGRSEAQLLGERHMRSDLQEHAPRVQAALEGNTCGREEPRHDPLDLLIQFGQALGDLLLVLAEGD